MVYTLTSADFEKGTIWQDGTFADDPYGTRLRTKNALLKSNAENRAYFEYKANKPLDISVLGYDDTDTLIYTTGWLPSNSNETVLSNKVYGLRIVLAYQGNDRRTPINPNDIEYFKVTTKTTWTIKNGYPVPINAPDLPEKAVTEPFPVSLWRVDKNQNGGYPFTGLMILTEPKGAFRKAEKLERVYIPESVKRIGAEAFRYTALKTVRIASDCEYSSTSFPEGCEVEFYGGGGDYGQLYDSDGYAVLDCEAARIYVKE